MAFRYRSMAKRDAHPAPAPQESVRASSVTRLLHVPIRLLASVLHGCLLLEVCYGARRQSLHVRGYAIRFSENFGSPAVSDRKNLGRMLGFC